MADIKSEQSKDPTVRLREEWPQALAPQVKMDEPNQEVTHYTGPMQWQSANGVYSLAGRIFTRWLPQPALRFEGESGEWIPGELDDGILLVPAHRWRVAASPSSFKGGAINGFLKDGVFGDPAAAIDQIHFEVANLKSFNGEPIQKWEGESRLSHRGRLVFEAGNHRITLDKSFSYSNEQRRLRSTGGYHCFYTGSIAMKDGGQCPFQELNAVLEGFSWYLQCINGRRTAPLFRRGMVGEQQIVADFRPYVTDQYKFVQSWTWDFLSFAVEDLWPAFWALYQDENDRECLTTALHWYVEANANAAFVEGSVVLVQNGLEMLWNWCQEKEMISRLLGPTENWDEPFSGKLTRLLEQFEIPTLIPATLLFLTEFVMHQTDIKASGPVVLTFIRNAHAHADAKKRQRLRAYPTMLTFEAVQLGIWYMELILLRLLDYQGQYYNRVMREMVEIKGMAWVPWSEGVKQEAASRRGTAIFTREEMDTFRQLIAQKASGLQQHEQKNFARINVDISNYLYKRVDGRDFLIIGTSIFRAIMDEVLALSCERYPDNFGKRDTALVLQALLDVERPPLVKNVAQFEEFIRTENFAWIVEVKDGQVVGDILRVDLFRHIKSEKEAKNGENEFIGGVFHAFKHFCFQGVPLSTFPDRNEIAHPTDIYEIIIRGFFLNPQKSVQGGAIISVVTLPDGRQIQFVFYHETNNDVYFIRSIRRR